MESSKPRILIIYTGGTIGMIEDANHNLVPFDFSHLIDNVPKAAALNYDLGHVQFNPPIDSSNMNPNYWNEIVKAVAGNYDSYDGFVVLHGTDTMAYTASALSFMLQGLNKPVILTGSQLPIGEIRQDGTENLITALEIAAAKDPLDGKPMVREVAISFENHLIRGNRATKRSSTNFDAFASFNYPELASMDLHIDFHKDFLLRPAVTRPFAPFLNMNTNLTTLFLYPGITEDSVKAQLSIPNLKGLILRTFGAGNAPTEKWFETLIVNAIKERLIVMNVTQCINGGDEQKRYATGDWLSEAGVISGGVITFEAALTKMMYLLGSGLTDSEVKQYLATDMVGEM